MAKPIYQAYLDMRSELQEFEIEVPSEYKAGVLNRVFPHKCFDKSFDYIRKNGDLPNVNYVEGVYTDFFLDHAWIEIDNRIVFEGTLQRFYDKETYYRQRKAVKLVDFNVDEAWEYLFREQQGLGKPEFWEAKNKYIKSTLS